MDSNAKLSLFSNNINQSRALVESLICSRGFCYLYLFCRCFSWWFYWMIPYQSLPVSDPDTRQTPWFPGPRYLLAIGFFLCRLGRLKPSLHLARIFLRRQECNRVSLVQGHNWIQNWMGFRKTHQRKVTFQNHLMPSSKSWQFALASHLTPSQTFHKENQTSLSEKKTRQKMTTVDKF